MGKPNSELPPLKPGELRLHAQQREVNADDSQNRVVVTGRRWGKTELDKKEAADEFGTPGLVWYIAPTFDMARDLMWEPIKRFTPREWLAKAPNDTRMELETIWGCRFACKSAEDPDRLRGRGPRKVICDEFQDWRDGERTWEEVLQPSLLTTRGRAFFTGTPKSHNHLYKLFRYGQPGGVPGWKSWQFKTSEASHIPRDFLAKMQMQMDPRSYRQEFEASFESLSGRAYYAFAMGMHVRQGVALSPHLPVGISFDFNVQPATAVVWQRQGDECVVWRECWVMHAGGEATEASATMARDYLAKVGWNGRIRIYGDPAGQSAKTTGPSDHAKVREIFPRAEWCIPLAAPHIKDRVDAVNARCKTQDGVSHIVVDASCKHLIDDLEQVTMPMLMEPTEKRKHPMLTHISDAFSYGVHFEWPPFKKTTGGAAFLPHLML